MRSTFSSLVAAALFVVAASAQTLTINTPSNVAECLPLQITWSGGTPPYTVSLASGTDPNGPALQILATNTQATSFSWSAVNFASGTSLDLNVRDSTGTLQQTAPFTVNPGTTDCLNGSSSSGASTAPSSTAASTPATSPASTAPSSTAPTSTAPSTSAASSAASSSKPTSSVPSSAASSSAKPSSASSTPNAAPTKAASYGAAAIIGAVVAAVVV
ncbi:hypothetical protein FA95DRAFT_1577323 [Auriscalpium vulgare]|uniref:Uncharacterized protein n=1 Tax=Auriscalpium vulgare TaxID=40419 RepID=A0ACB8R702_9AGAM|nr:hypothetical protein FA95DRAFT_1577323 [Auriscalpium vulgare]